MSTPNVTHLRGSVSELEKKIFIINGKMEDIDKKRQLNLNDDAVSERLKLIAEIHFLEEQVVLLRTQNRFLRRRNALRNQIKQLLGVFPTNNLPLLNS